MLDISVLDQLRSEVVATAEFHIAAADKALEVKKAVEAAIEAVKGYQNFIVPVTLTEAQPSAKPKVTPTPVDVMAGKVRVKTSVPTGKPEAQPSPNPEVMPAPDPEDQPIEGQRGQLSRQRLGELIEKLRIVITEGVGELTLLDLEDISKVHFLRVMKKIMDEEELTELDLKVIENSKILRNLVKELKQDVEIETKPVSVELTIITAAEGTHLYNYEVALYKHLHEGGPLPTANQLGKLKKARPELAVIIDPLLAQAKKVEAARRAQSRADRQAEQTKGGGKGNKGGK